MNKTAGANLTKTDQWFRFWMPYTFHPLDAKKRVYLPLNRNYKPLGYTSKVMVDYEDYRPQAVIFGADPHTVKDVWTSGQGLYLYNDGPSSRTDYFERFERLMSRSIRLARTPSRS